MNKDDFKEIKLFIGPMTKNIVDSTIDYCNDFNVKLGFIPSRRQIEFDKSGYVNNWTTRTFSEYVRKKIEKIILVRDHGGPDQGLTSDDGFASLFQDCINFDIIHIDVWKKYKNFNDGLNQTIEYIKYCNNINDNIFFEIGTEEAIRKININELEILMYELKNKLPENIFNKIIYLVIQSGTALKENKNIGNYDKNILKSMVQIANNYNVLSKEHNSDFLNIEDIHDRFNNGLSTINIAPEFGRMETMAILKITDLDSKFFDKFYNLCFNSGRWQKWVNRDFIPEENKLELIKICGHYLISNEEMQKMIKPFQKEIKKNVKNELYNKINKILKR